MTMTAMTTDRRTDKLNEPTLDQLFRTARSRNRFLDRVISDETIREIYELAKWGPTSLNTSPGRFVFIRTPAGKERLKPHLYPMNTDKMMSAPCCVIVARDTRFYDETHKLFPGRDVRSVFAGNEALIEDTARRNATLQGAYLMFAARALGLDCGPMSGFVHDTLNADFFPDGRWQADFLCNIGYGSEEYLFPRNPRLSFEDACQLL